MSGSWKGCKKSRHGSGRALEAVTDFGVDAVHRVVAAEHAQLRAMEYVGAQYPAPVPFEIPAQARTK